MTKSGQTVLNVLQGNSSQLYSAITLKSKTKGNETKFYVYETFFFFFFFKVVQGKLTVSLLI